MNVLGDVVARDRRTDDPALRTDSRAGSYSYEKFCTATWKAGNLLSHYGVRSGVTVAVDPGDSLSPPPLVAFFGAALLGAATTFDPDDDVETGALVAPGDSAPRYETAPGTQVLTYGDDLDDPQITGFERGLWSENPTEPPERVSPDTDALLAAGKRFSHERLLTAAERVATDLDLTADDVVAPRASLTEPGAVVAGLVAPLLVGATVLLDVSSTGDVAVVGDSDDVVREPRTVDPATVLD